MPRSPKKHWRSAYSYDVALSFAGEDRKYVREVARHLRANGVRVFYDEFEAAQLWGTDLYEHFDYLYREAALFCIMFISKHYASKLWTNHERKSAQERAFHENRAYILPAKFDDTTIPGVRGTVHYIDLRRYLPQELASLFLHKLAPFSIADRQAPRNYFPPAPDLLYKAMRVKSAREKKVLSEVGAALHRAITRMNKSERLVIANLLVHSCPHDLPDNLHIDMDLLTRVTGMREKQVRTALTNLNSLGFDTTLPKKPRSTARVSKMRLVYLRWIYWSKTLDEIAGQGGQQQSNFTNVAATIATLVARHYCSEHAIEAIIRCNYSCLSTTTAIPHHH